MALIVRPSRPSLFFFFNDTATTEIYTLSLHDALPICPGSEAPQRFRATRRCRNRARCRSTLRWVGRRRDVSVLYGDRSEEHTSELQSRLHLVCRLLLEKKKTGPCMSTISPSTVRRLCA